MSYYHDQPLRRLDVEPGWCPLLRSLRAIEDAWHFAKPLGTLGVVLLLAGRCHQGAQRIIYYLKSGWSFITMVVIQKKGTWNVEMRPLRTDEFLLDLLRPVFSRVATGTVNR